MKKNIWFCLVLVLISFQAVAQKPAQQQIVDLHNGVLIVNLIVPNRKIEALEASGQKDEAQKVAAEAKKTNQNIIDAFTTHYTFSKVYFVYGTDIQKLASGDGSVLFDANNQPLYEVPATFFIADFSGSPERKMEGLVLKDDQFNTLKKPMPYFISAWDFFHLNRLPETVIVDRFNKKLERYYAKVLQK